MGQSIDVRTFSNLTKKFLHQWTDPHVAVTNPGGLVVHQLKECSIVVVIIIFKEI